MDAFTIKIIFRFVTGFDENKVSEFNLPQIYQCKLLILQNVCRRERSRKCHTTVVMSLTYIVNIIVGKDLGKQRSLRRYKTEGSPTPNGGEICSNFAAPSPGVIENRNHGRSLTLFQQWQHGSGFCSNFRTSGST